MNTRRYLAFLAAVLITVAQALIFATDTAASAARADTEVAAQRPARAGAANA